jgi:hypothetical protein
MLIPLAAPKIKQEESASKLCFAIFAFTDSSQVKKHGETGQTGRDKQ